jgi:chromosome partitioning protein
VTEIIVVTNRKGGVGKSTIATHIASGLSLEEYRTALVDTDPQGHGAVFFGMKKEDGLYRVLCDEDTQLQDVVRRVDPARYSPKDALATAPLYLLPSNKATARIPLDNNNPFAFRQMLDAMAEWLSLDFIIVDTGPTASLFDGSVYFAANWFLYVTELAHMSFDGLSESIREMRTLNKQNSKYRQWSTEILGIIPNKARYKTVSQRNKSAELAGQLDLETLIWEPILLGTNWEDATNYGQMMYSLLPDGKEAKAARRMVRRVLEGVGAHER